MNNLKVKEPILMQNQESPLNADIFAQEEFKRLQKHLGLKYAVETGTCLGYTTKFLSEFYEQVRTIEINDEFREIALQNRLSDCSNVFCFKGSSSDLLLGVLSGLDDSTFIFLDAHWGNHCPLKDELRQIKESGIKPVIAIHDFFVPNHPELGFDEIHGQPFTYEWLKEDIDAVYGEGGYAYFYNSESEGAKRGIIYIYPIVKDLNLPREKYISIPLNLEK